MRKRKEPSSYQLVSDSLNRLEGEMKNLGIWSESTPPADAFLSQQPFCYDTMTLPQWLQFVFISKMREIVSAQLPLPSQCGITPMADEYVKAVALKNGEQLLVCLSDLDEKLGGVSKN